MLKRLLATLAVLATAAFGSLAVAAPATADPCSQGYTQGCTPVVAITVTNPVSGEAFTITVYTTPNTAVTIYLFSSPTVIGRGVSDANGVANVTATIPAGFSGSHTIEAVDASGNVLQSIPVSVAASSGGSASTSGGGTVAGGGSSSGSGNNLASTGAAVTGIGIAGLGLVVGGGVLLYSGRRRRENCAEAA